MREDRRSSWLGMRQDRFEELAAIVPDADDETLTSLAAWGMVMRWDGLLSAPDYEDPPTAPAPYWRVAVTYGDL